MLNIKDLTILMFVQEVQDKLGHPSYFEKIFNLPECEREFIKLCKGVPLYQLNTLRDDVRLLADSIVRYNQVLTNSKKWDTNIILLASLQFVMVSQATCKTLSMASLKNKIEEFPYFVHHILACINTAVNANNVG